MTTRSVITMIVLIVLLSAMVPSGVTVVAQGQAPDLAAMSLAPEDVPSGYFDDYGEWLVPAPAIGELILGDAAPAGLEWLYQSFSFNPADNAAIHVFLLVFASPDQATVDAATFEALLRPPLPEGTVTGPTQAPGVALGEEPRATTFVSYDTWASGGPRADVVAVSFRRDQLIAGVSVERFIDPPPDDTPVADAASPVVTDPAQEKLASNLAGILDGRITDVLAGTAPVGTDLGLGPKVLPVDHLADDPIPTWGGYKSGIDLLRCGICGEETSLATFAEAARVGYARGGVMGSLVDGEPQPPFVSVGVLVMASPEDSLALLEAIGRAPNDLPVPIPVPRGSRTLAEAPTIAGADAALAYHAAMNADDPQAAVDSAGVVFVLDEWLVFVDVLGGLSVEDAVATATDLATQQAGCLASADPCTSVTQPPALAASSAHR